MRIVVPVCLCLASFAARSEDLLVSLGKQRAAGSAVQWEIREAGHPVLGNIRFAFMKEPVSTPVGSARIMSRVYISCEPTSRHMAIEIAHGTAPDDPNGLQPRTLPKLVCTTPASVGERRLVQDPLTARWEVNSLGDVLARGLRAFPLRDCVSIGVTQEVMLPKGWGRESALVELEITPYNRELDQIFAMCGEVSAYDPETRPPAARAAAARPSGGGWREARVLSTGRTNVRAAPDLQSEVVIQLDPGAVVLVQRQGKAWWKAKVKSPSGAPYEGFIRQDRLAFK